MYQRIESIDTGNEIQSLLTAKLVNNPDLDKHIKPNTPIVFK